MSFQLELAAPSFYGATIDALANLQTDIHGIRIKKFVKFFRESKRVVSVLDQEDIHEISFTVNDIEIFFIKRDDIFEVRIGEQSYFIQDDFLLDQNGHVVDPVILTPRIIRPLLVA